MDRTGRTSPDPRRRGSASLLLLAVLVLAAGVLAFLWITRPRTTPGAGEAAPRTTGATGTPSGTPDSPGPAESLPKGLARWNPDGARPDEASPLQGTAVRFHGTVTRKDGTPVAAATVVIASAQGSDLLPMPIGRQSKGERFQELLASGTSARSDAAGRFELLAPPPAEGVTVAGAWAPGCTVELKPALPVPKDGDARFDFVLDPATEVTGRVLEKGTGNPATGVRVVATEIRSEQPAALAFLPPSGPASVVGTDGTYAILAVPPGEYRVVPTPGDSEFLGRTLDFGRKIVAHGGDVFEDVDFEVEAGGVILGRVVAEDDEPVAGARIRTAPTDFLKDFFDSSPETMSMFIRNEVRSDEAGRFRLRALTLGKQYTVFASEEHHAPAWTRDIEAAPAARAAEIVLRLTAGSTIRGTVRYDGGAPAPRVQVALLPAAGELFGGNLFPAIFSGDTTTKTGENGAFTFERVPAGEYSLLAGGLVGYNPLAKSGVPVKTDGIEDVTDVEVVLHSESGALSGVVLDDLGEPVPQARVKATCLQPDFTRVKTTTTDAAGGFSFGGFEERLLRLDASKTGYTPATLEGIRGDETGVTLTLPRAARVSGVVLGPEGAPVTSGFRVAAEPFDEDEAGGKQGFNVADLMSQIEATTHWVQGAEDGTFTIESAPSGTIRIRAEASGFAPGSSEPLFVGPGQTLEGVEVRMDLGAVIAGRVVDESGAPVSGARVSLTRKTGNKGEEMLRQMMPSLLGRQEGTITDASGRYEFPALEEGAYDLVANRDGFAPSDTTDLSVRPGEARTAPDLVLTRGGGLAGIVTDQGKPKPGMLVQVVGNGPLRTDTTNSEGRFRLDALKAGDYVVTVTDMKSLGGGGQIRFKTRAVSIPPGETVEVEIAFGTGLRVHGRIGGLAKDRSYMVAVRRPGGPGPEDYSPLDFKKGIEASKYQVGVSFVGKDGTYSIEGIDPGEYILELLALPGNMMDLQAYADMDRTPPHRATIRIEDQDLKHDFDID